MRIVMVHPNDIFSPFEPWTRRIKNLAREFSRKGHRVSLVYFRLSSNRISPDSSNEGYEVIPLIRSLSPIALFKNIRVLIKLTRRADIVHFQKCHYYASIPAVIAAYVNKKPLHYDWDDWEEMIWYESCGRSPQALFVGLLFRIFENLLVRLADTLSVSSHKLNELAIGYGAKARDIYLAPVGVDLQEFCPGENTLSIEEKFGLKHPIVLYVGQLHGAQYIDLFIEAANIILHKQPNVNFMIVGGGFMENPLRDLVYKRGIEDKVIFAGAVNHSDIPGYIACADICVAPFRATKVTACKSPLKIVEYMAMSKPVVAGNVGEVRNMLGGVGILVEPGDINALVNAILDLLKSPQLREALGRHARQRVESFYTWENTAATLLSAYQRTEDENSIHNPRRL